MKELLVKEFGEEICFSYRRDKRKSQMFFSSRIQPSEIIETLQSSNLLCRKLQQECKAFEFNLENSYCDGMDLRLSYDAYKENRPETWELF